MWGWLLEAVLPYVAVAFAGLVALLYRSKAKSAARDLKEANEYAETRKRLDEAGLGDDPAVLRDWLRDRDPKQR